MEKIKEISIEINLKPTPWKRPGGKGLRYDMQIDDKVAFSYKVVSTETIRNIRAKAGLQPIFLSGPLQVEALFAFKAKGAANEACERREDLDNLVKFTLDAMQSQYLDGVIWTDDRQVCKIIADKIIHPDRDFIRVKVSRMESKL